MRPPRRASPAISAHLGVAQLEIKQREILFQPLDLAGARNDDDALLHQPAQADLRRDFPCALPICSSTLSPLAPPRAIGL